MAIYQGPPRPFRLISLVQPEPKHLLAALAVADLTDQEKEWFRRAQRDDGCFYFVVQRQERLLGQVFLHDIDRNEQEALIGYHVFRSKDRRHGYGSDALRAICDYAAGELHLRRLLVITSLDNVASRRIAVKAGFRELGAAREGPQLVVCERLPGIETSPSP